MSKQVVVPVVIDTNVLVPSLYSRTRILEFILSSNLVIVWNSFVYEEAKRIIKKLNPIYLKKAGIKSEDIIELLDNILDEEFRVSEMPSGWPKASPDRDDDPFLYAAEAGGARFIISGDERHMLKLGSFNGIPIGTPGTFFPWVIQHFPMTNIR